MGLCQLPVNTKTSPNAARNRGKGHRSPARPSDTRCDAFINLLCRPRRTIWSRSQTSPSCFLGLAGDAGCGSGLIRSPWATRAGTHLEATGPAWSGRQPGRQEEEGNRLPTPLWASREEGGGRCYSAVTRTQPRLPVSGLCARSGALAAAGRAGGRRCLQPQSAGPPPRRLLTAPHPASALTLPGARRGERAVASTGPPRARGAGQASLGVQGVRTVWRERGALDGLLRCGEPSARGGQDPRFPLLRGAGVVGQVLPRGRETEGQPGLVPGVRWPVSPAGWLLTQNPDAVGRGLRGVGPPPVARLPTQDPLGSGSRAGCVLPGQHRPCFLYIAALLQTTATLTRPSPREQPGGTVTVFLSVNGHLEELKGLFV